MKKNLFHASFLAFVALSLSAYAQNSEALNDYGIYRAEHASPPIDLPVSQNNVPQTLSLIENRGQWDSDARFLMRGPNVNIWVSDNGFVYDFYRNHYTTPDNANPQSVIPHLSRREGHVVEVRFEGSSPSARAIPLEPTGEVVNYLIGSQENHKIGVPLYRNSRIEGLYPGVDALLYQENGQPRYDLIVEPGTNPSSIRISFAGAEELTLASNGNLQIGTTLGDIVQSDLFAYQVVNGTKEKVECSFKLVGNAVQFEVGAYDQQRPLVIDPIVTATYIGGSGWENVGPSDGNTSNLYRVAIDPRDNTVLLAGGTASDDFPTTPGAYDVSYNGPTVVDPVTAWDGVYGRLSSWGGDMFVMKLTPDGKSIIFSTYIGGADQGETPNGIAVDPRGNIWIVGATASNDFPTTPDAFQKHAGRVPDTTGGKQNQNSQTNWSDGIILKLSSDGSSLLYSSYLHVNDNRTDPNDGSTYTNIWSESVTDLALSRDGNVWIVGNAPWGLPTTQNAYRKTWSGRKNRTYTPPTAFTNTTSSSNIFFGCMNPTTHRLEYLSYVNDPTREGLGNTDGDIRIDPEGNILISGYASKFLGGFGLVPNSVLCNLPTTPGTYRPDPGAEGAEAWVGKFDPSGRNLIWGTYVGRVYGLGGWSNSLDVDSKGRPSLLGVTYDPNFPVTPNALDSNFNGSHGGYLLRLTADGTLDYSMVFDGIDAHFHALDQCDNIWFVSMVNRSAPGDVAGWITPNAFNGDLASYVGQYPYTQELICVSPDFESIQYASYLHPVGGQAPILWRMVPSSNGTLHFYGFGGTGLYTTEGAIRRNPSIDNSPFDFEHYYFQLFADELKNVSVAVHDNSGGSGTTICRSQIGEVTWDGGMGFIRCRQGYELQVQLLPKSGGASMVIATVESTKGVWSDEIPDWVPSGEYYLRLVDRISGTVMYTSNLITIRAPLGGLLASDLKGSAVKAIVYPPTKVRESRDTAVVIANASPTCELRILGGSVRFESGDIRDPNEFRIIKALGNTTYDPVQDMYIMAPMSQDTLVVRFTPVRDGSRRATMRVVTDQKTNYIPGITAPGELYWDFYGLGIPGNEKTEADIYAEPITFTPIEIGVETSRKQLRIENTNLKPLTIERADFADWGSPEFEWDEMFDNPKLPLELRPGDVVFFGLKHFSPSGSDGGIKNGMLILKSSDGDTLGVRLQGFAGSRTLEITPSEIHMSTLDIRSVRTRVVLTNSGTLPISIESINLRDGRHFAISQLERRVIEPGWWEFVEVLYTPSGDGPHDDALIIYSNANSGGSSVPQQMELQLHGLTSSTSTEIRPEGSSARPTTGSESTDLSLLQLYPQPARTTLTITWYQPTATNVQMQMYDVSGRSVMATSSEAQDFPVGRNEVDVDISALTAGLYYYELKVGTEVIRQPVMIVH
ncbi:MAG: T9SS type A sorting domain-containing protein [Ignavibacteriae bacterium]|nr:T9SS type A sorting domain-containing protein [Ignavibacteriota bacterium]MCB9214599.1 T9SS type A sorting domain-containing protein [Ignavibacteria bacterium]